MKNSSNISIVIFKKSTVANVDVTRLPRLSLLIIRTIDYMPIEGDTYRDHTFLTGRPLRSSILFVALPTVFIQGTRFLF